MSLGGVLREARQQANLTQGEIAEIGFVSPQTISAIERGQRRIQPDVLLQLVEKLDNPWLAMQAISEITGGVYCSPILDGEVELCRAGVWAQTLFEMRHAQVALEGVPLIRKPLPGSADAERVREVMLQLLSVRAVLDNLVAICCEEYRLSVIRLYQVSRERLEREGLLRPKEKGRLAATK